MKRLILIRHAKSSWEHDVIDHDRPLSQRGINDATIIAKDLKKESLNPDALLVSDAVRTKMTAEIIVSQLSINKDLVRFSHDLYDFSGHNLVQIIKSCNKDFNELMVFGHNHAVTAFVNNYGSKYIENVPTCGVVIIDFDIDNWNDLKKGKTLKTIFPKDFRFY